GIDARIFRISFTGELSFEINVPSRYGLAIWEAVVEAGSGEGITPYGTEAMHVLRAEKGFIIVGQETDGSVTPLHLGMGRMVSNAQDFIGRRWLRRPAMTRPDRKQLVGLLPQQQAKVLPEGTQLVVDAVAVRSGLMLKPQQAQVSGNHSRSIGYITSSYF